MLEFDDPEVFLDEDGFAEWVTFVPINDRPRRILMVIEREHWKKFGPGAGKGDIAPYTSGWLSSDPIRGASKIDTGGDAVKFARRQGFAAEPQMIAEVLPDSTPKMWHIRFR
jgi:hypothetical protein